MPDFYVECEVVHIYHTDSAVLIAFDGEEHWIPRSCLAWTSDREIDSLRRGQDCRIKIAGWMAVQKGLEF